MKTLASRGVVALMAGLVVASSGCGYGLGAGTGSRGPHDAGGAVRLNVTNQSGGPMEVYVAGSGTVYRIGTVHPGLAGHFVVRPAMIGNGPVEFAARSDDGPLVRSGRILVVPGDVVDFELGARAALSSATVRPRLPGHGRKIEGRPVS
jgi:hypothetical protein